jgi:SAM-dependent methyltransferase
MTAYTRQAKIDFFVDDIPADARILEIGCGDGWVRDHLARHGRTHYVGMDLVPPADVVGDIRNWRELGLEPASFDVIIALEVIEHVVIYQEMYDLLKPGGMLVVTTPVPGMDWLCKLLETMGVNQKRTSPHDHLIDFKDIPFFEPVETRTVKLIGQWGKFRKPSRRASDFSVVTPGHPD